MNKGILYIILSGICFIVVNFFVKLLGAGQESLFGDFQDYPAHELVLARSIVSFTISLAIIKQKKLPVFGHNKKWLIIRGLAGTAALTIFFNTIHHLPMAVAATVQYLSTVFTVVFAMILIKEKVKLLQWMFIGLSFVGTALISFGDSGNTLGKAEISIFWIGMGIISAVLSGVAYVAIMKLKQTDAPITIVLYFPMIATPIMSIMCLWDFTMPVGIEWLFLLLIGIFTQFAQITLTKAFHEGSASTITPFQYLGAVYTFIVGYLIFNETLSNTIVLGIVLVITGVVINALMRRS